ncbi:MAG: helix-turn-helix transcriptional regulator [Desulfobacula sp.]|nr:helix-turn-helix transcriptional regulator [Desulfobacula sp.]
MYIKNSINSNVDKIILPIIYDLENQFPQGNQKNLQLLKSSLTEITSPFINKISNAVLSLTPTELQICNMIKSGLKTKEISKLRHISSSTVNRHRERIRKKLGITNEDINLATYLMSIS